MNGLPNAPERAALFLDFDGTLVEIAERPDAVVVPEGLPPLLLRLSRLLDGALSVVSGRTLEQLDHFLPVPIAKAGAHGGQIRLQPGEPVESPPLPLPPEAWRKRADGLAIAFPGVLIEEKEHGFALHYRQAPEAASVARVLLDALVAEQPDDFLLLPARMAWEITPKAVSKGTAVAALMARPPFFGRVPVFVGDDVTDEAGMAMARKHGGQGFKLQDVFGTPETLRTWLERLESQLRA